MSAVAEANSVYLDEFRELSRTEPGWLAERREAGIRAFEQQGFPHRRMEAWRNLKTGGLTQHHYRHSIAAGTVPMALTPTAAVVPTAHRLVFVDGLISQSHAMIDTLPEGVSLRSLAQVLEHEPDVLEQDLALHAELDQHPFASLNTAFWTDGVVLDVDADTQLDKPVVLVFLTSEAAEHQASYPRVLIRAGAGAELDVIQVHAGPAGLSYLACPVTEIVAGANSSVRFHQLQEEGDAGAHIGLVHAQLDRDARLALHGFSVGGKIARTDFYVNLAAEGAQATLNGLYLVGDGQYSDYHTWVRHQAPHCNSHQTFKGVLEGRAESVFDGLIQVSKGAQKTDSQQQNRNLLLSPRALAHSNPRLEIYADDVKCAHGSTVGELDEDALFYLRSRGVGEQDARGLLTFAFANEMLEPVTVEALRDYERQRLSGLLPGDASVKELS
ncbi:MAG: Fe-S cluster assembly protein SufD [Ectothiorhodospiraceae bacterium]|nr:Fe-S cluster assembly protein SufD [Ectothiorhodospiraceae bacterium]